MTAFAISVEKRPQARRAHIVRRFAHQRVGLSALVVLTVLLVAGALAPEMAPQGPDDIHLGGAWMNHPPVLSGWHLFGTDNIGRDVLVRTLYGIHTSEQAALLAGLIATMLGGAVGAFAGYSGGWRDALLMRLADLVTAFPTLMVLYAAFVFLQPVGSAPPPRSLRCISGRSSHELYVRMLLRSAGASSSRRRARSARPISEFSFVTSSRTSPGQCSLPPPRSLVRSSSSRRLSSSLALAFRPKYDRRSATCSATPP